MRLAALYDIHGNLPALDAVLKEVASTGVERIVVGGDVVPGPMPRETLDRLRSLAIPVEFIIGNGELAVLAEADGKDSGVPAQYRESIRWSAAQLQPADQHWLAKWPLTLRMRIDDLGDVLFCHAAPNNPHATFTRVTPEPAMMSLIGELHADLMVCGHTHMQYDRHVRALRIVNSGSVGMPFGRPGAFWVLLGREVELRRTSYDLEKAASKIRLSGYPGADHFADHNVLQPPSEEIMLKTFAQS